MTEEDYSTSEFLEPEDQQMPSTMLTDIEPITYNDNPCVHHHPANCRIYRGKRYGQWWTLKCLTPEAAKREVCRENFRKEFNIGISLWHPNIVRVIGFYPIEQLDNAPCIVLEYIDGMTLCEFLGTKPSNELKIKILDEIISAMEYYMGKQVIHCDLKPTNILITRNGYNVKIIDFGLSDTDSHNYLKGHAGTDEFAAPEQKTGNAPVDCRVDFYALGKIMQKMDLPWKWKRIMKRCMKENPDDRYQNPSQLRQAFNKARKKVQLKVPIFMMTALALIMAWAFVIGHMTSKSGTQPQYVSRDKVVSGDLPAVYFGDTVKLGEEESVFVVPTSSTLYYEEDGASVLGPIDPGKAVDLGLSVKWAPFNVGCERVGVNHVGAYYCWGDSTGRFYGKDMKEILGNRPKGDISGTEMDFAKKKWGGKWRMPTKEEFEELIMKCQWTYLKKKGSVAGYVVTGPSGNSIFLPFGGKRYATDFSDQGIVGYYWCGTPANEMAPAANYLKIDNQHVNMNDDSEIEKGYSLRPVLDK